MSLLANINHKISTKNHDLKNYFDEKFRQYPALIYNSVDIRHNSHKIAPVDTNCYPAGFNNLSNIGQKNCQKQFEIFLQNYFISQNSGVNLTTRKNIFIIPENHTRNQKYLENLLALQKILSENYQIFITTYNPEILEKTTLEIENSSSLTFYPLQKISGKLAINENNQKIFADFAILNNDLTNGIPEILQNLTTPINPSINLGWFQRTKTNHFDIYNQIAQEIGTILDIDYWLISSLHDYCDNLDFKENIGYECLVKQIDKILAQIQEKYRQHQINLQPYCFLKANNGTYGMAVWAVKDSNEILEINKKERNKMNVIKGSTQTHSVIIQEGIFTEDKINDGASEPLLYIANGNLIEIIHRTNPLKDDHGNLNSAGAIFYNSQNIDKQNHNLKIADFNNLYQLIANMTALASALELNKFLTT
ncbi:MAG: glutamate--cysteine ligase [Alphaproteobacteria bacterium]